MRTFRSLSPAFAGLFIALSSQSVNAASVCVAPHCDSEDGPRGWAFEAGVAFITTNNIEDFVPFRTPVERAKGPGGGEIYTLTATRRLGEIRWNIGGHTFTPQLEAPFTLEIVDENGSDPFVDINASFTVRWIDFPWNKYVATTFAMGVGLSYSQNVYLMDQIRHPGEDRSRLKFNWPIQLTLAHPDYAEHQLMFFIAHQSGGHIFDEGGVNSIGVGYRRDF